MNAKKYLFLFGIAAAFVFFSEAAFAAASVQVRDQALHEEKLNVVYPQFTGIEDAAVEKKINMDVKVDVEKFIASCKNNAYNLEGAVSYEIRYLDGDMLSFTILTYEFNGGAHGMSYLTGYTYDLKTGSKLSLTQLFDYRPSEITQAIFRFAKENDVYLFDEFKGIREYPRNFYLSERKKPVLLFQQYEIAPYSSGILKIEMQ